jgi:hypothetical protein
MNTGDLLSEADWQFMLNPPDTDQNAWNYGTQLIDEFFAPDAPFWVETNSIGELIANDIQSPFNGQAGSGSGNDTGGGSRSVMQQTGNGIDFLPTRAPSEVLDAVVSTNQQSSSHASPGPVLSSPSVVVSDTELPAAERAEISKMSSSIFGGEHDSDVAMEDSSPPPFIRATTPLVVGREGALTLPYGTDGTAARTPHRAQKSPPHVPMNASNAPAQTLRATPNMVSTAALYSSSPYYRGRHTQSTHGAESLRRDMEQQLNVFPDTTAAIPFVGLRTQDTTSPAQETAEEEEPAITPAKVTKKRASTRKPKLTTEATTSSVPETAEADESNITLAKVTNKAPKAPKRKAQAEPMRQELSAGTDAGANKKARARDSVSSREVYLLTGVKVEEEEDKNKRKTRATAKKGGGKVAGPNAGEAVKQRRLEKKSSE